MWKWTFFGRNVFISMFKTSPRGGGPHLEFQFGDLES